MGLSRFNRTELKILRMLSDGARHTKKELLDCLYDSYSDPQTIHVHIYKLRKKLNLLGQDIAAERRRRVLTFRHVILIRHDAE